MTSHGRNDSLHFGHVGIGKGLELSHYFVVVRATGPHVFQLRLHLLLGLDFGPLNLPDQGQFGQTSSFLFLLLEPVGRQLGSLLAEAILGNINFEKFLVLEFADFLLSNFFVVLLFEGGFDVVILLARRLAHGSHFSHLGVFYKSIFILE